MKKAILFLFALALLSSCANKLDDLESKNLGELTTLQQKQFELVKTDSLILTPCLITENSVIIPVKEPIYLSTGREEIQKYVEVRNRHDNMEARAFTIFLLGLALFLIFLFGVVLNDNY